jgi:hypothetical protein
MEFLTVTHYHQNVLFFVALICALLIFLCIVLALAYREKFYFSELAHEASNQHQPQRPKHIIAVNYLDGGEQVNTIPVIPQPSPESRGLSTRKKA